MFKPLKHLFFAQVAFSSLLCAEDISYDLDDFLNDNFSIADTQSKSTNSQTTTQSSSNTTQSSVSQPDTQSYPPVAPKLKQRYTVSGELLYLKPEFDGLPWLYVYDNSQFNSQVAGTSSNQYANLKVIDLPFDLGFRLAAGFNPTWLNLELLLTWERLYTQNTSQEKILYSQPITTYNQPVVYREYWGYNVINIVGQYNTAQNTTSFHWNKIDLTAAIPLKGMNRFMLSPFMGLRGLITNFSSVITFIANALGSTPTLNPPANYSVTQLLQKFNAIGFLGGLSGDIDCGQGFHVKGLMDGALVFGQLHSAIYDRKFQYQASWSPYLSSFTINPHRFVPIIDAQATVYWNKDFYDNRVNLSIHLGYEGHWLFNFYEYLSPQSQRRRNLFDLSLQGLNAGISLSF